MSLDISIVLRTDLFKANITHNLGEMAEAAGIYQALWRPEELGIYKAGRLITLLEAGIKLLEDDPERFKKLNPENGWGNYEGLLEVSKDYLKACRTFSDYYIEVDR